MRTIDRNPALYEKRPEPPLSTRLILYAIAASVLALIILGVTRVIAHGAGITGPDK